MQHRRGRTENQRRRCGHAFTLIEILTVIAILAILIGILIPVLSHVREAGRSTTCLNNLHQLGAAFLAYATDNNGRFPRPGAINPQPPPPAPLAPKQVPEDWVMWAPGFDPDKGAIVPYMGGQFVASHFICPSDTLELHPGYNSPYFYPYSYSVNEMICGSVVRAHRPLQLQQIMNPAEKILIIDEMSETLDDGCWAFQDYQGFEFNILAARHHQKIEDQTDLEKGTGNVCFVDGHACIIGRKDTFTAHHYDPLVP